MGNERIFSGKVCQKGIRRGQKGSARRLPPKAGQEIPGWLVKGHIPGEG